jgi:hypothetical protein
VEKRRPIDVLDQRRERYRDSAANRLGSARVSRAGFGVPPKRTFLLKGRLRVFPDTDNPSICASSLDFSDSVCFEANFEIPHLSNPNVLKAIIGIEKSGGKRSRKSSEIYAKA